MFLAPFPNNGMAAGPDRILVPRGFRRGGVQVVDVTSPDQPGFPDPFDGGGRAYCTIQRGDHLYVTSGTGLEVFDVSEPLHPRHVVMSDAASGRWDVTVEDNLLFTLGNPPESGPNALQIVDILDRERPRLLGRFNPHWDPRRVAVAGGMAYLAGYKGVDVIDVTDPTEPQRIASHEIGGGHSIIGIEVRGRYAYLAAYEDGFQVMDVSDPTHWTSVGHLEMDGTVMDVLLVGDHAYVTVQERGYPWNPGSEIVAVDVSDPTALRVVRSVHVKVFISGRLERSGDLLFAVAEDQGIRAFDITHPERFREVGRFPQRIGARSDTSCRRRLAAGDGYLYRSAADSGLHAFRVYRSN
jgi:hypothetical protein